MEQPASPLSPSVAPPRQQGALSYAPRNRLAPRWVPGAGRPASAAPEPECLGQPWMYASRPRRMDVPSLPRRRRASWLPWLMVLALAGLGGYGLSGIDRGEAWPAPAVQAGRAGGLDRQQAPALGLHAESMPAAHEPKENSAPVAAPPAAPAAREGQVQESRVRPAEATPAELAAAIPALAAPAASPPAPAASPPAPAAPGAGARDQRPGPARAGMECSDALAAMQLCGLGSSRAR